MTSQSEVLREKVVDKPKFLKKLLLYSTLHTYHVVLIPSRIFLVEFSRFLISGSTTFLCRHKERIGGTNK
jgi:hypothetical protein